MSGFPPPFPHVSTSLSRKTPLRYVSQSRFSNEAALFPPKEARLPSIWPHQARLEVPLFLSDYLPPSFSALLAGPSLLNSFTLPLVSS